MDNFSGHLTQKAPNREDAAAAAAAAPGCIFLFKFEVIYVLLILKVIY